MSGLLEDTSTVAASSDEPTVPDRPQRPLLLTLVTLLLYARALLVGSNAVLLIIGVYAIDGSFDPSVWPDLALPALMLGLGIWLLMAATGLWLLKPWAWQMNMLVLGFLLIVNLWQRASSTNALSNQFGMALNILSVFYLIQGDVRALFSRQPRPAPET